MKIKPIVPVALVMLAASSPVIALADASPLAAADNGFGFKLLKQLAHDQPTQNLFVSPYSASTVLQMVGNGATGQTKTEMQQVLETANLSDADVNAANKKAAQYFNNQDTNLVLLSANNA
ncbi:MAG TPA: serpin family protein, partial [Phycisphaerae bacterium]|nr:serpin family protein [Phycisphaerae bacterium]